jgi:hypothetical protein
VGQSCPCHQPFPYSGLQASLSATEFFGGIRELNEKATLGALGGRTAN